MSSQTPVYIIFSVFSEDVILLNPYKAFITTVLEVSVTHTKTKRHGFQGIKHPLTWAHYLES